MATYEMPPIAGTSTTFDRENPSIVPSALDRYSPEELLALRERIDEKLPHRTLNNVNLEKELVIQLGHAQKLQKDTLDDDQTPANQKAQVLNSVASTLQMLGKLQIELYDAERLKRLEQILVEAIKNLPKESQEQFLEAYERELVAGT